MPSSRAKTQPQAIVFLPLVLLIFVLWVFYRTLFTFPVWFDETVGKAIFFGLPVWLFVTATRFSGVLESFAPYKFKTGVLWGLALGGVFGFVGSLISLWQHGAVVEAVWLFQAPAFWQEFILAIMTGFWETLLFFSFIMTMIQFKFSHWSLGKQVFLVALVFVAFHLPVTLTRFAEVAAPLLFGQLAMLFLFAVGQSLLFAFRRNAYMLVFTHAIWGMVLLTHGW